MMTAMCVICSIMECDICIVSGLSTCTCTCTQTETFLEFSEVVGLVGGVTNHFHAPPT